MIIHTVNKPAPHQALALCLRFATASDVIVLLEDGVCNGLSGTTAWLSLESAAGTRVLAMQPDLVARGLAGKQATTLELIDYPALVELCCQCDKVQSWF
jgi:tRNA 2-thiouridine synthesizing protein B